MEQTVLLDQYSLSELGSDRGLGRYATMLAAGVAELESIGLKRLLRTASSLRAPDLLHIQRDIWKLKLDKAVPYHSTSVYHLPLIKDRPWICSIQDVIPLDLNDYSKFGVKSRLLFANAKRADMILANSAYTKRRIASRLGVRVDRILTCALPISPAFAATPSKESVSKVVRILKVAGIEPGKPFMVALADLRTPDPRKRYHWIDQVARSLCQHKVPTVVTGRGLSQEDFPHSKIIQTLNDEELSALYSQAVAMYYPTAYEGQGLPPQEAMASGCPVVAYRNTSVEEVVSSSDYLLDDPNPWEHQNLSETLSPSACDEVTSKILRWIDSPDELVAARLLAEQLAESYSWDSFSDNLGAFYSAYFNGRRP